MPLCGETDGNIEKKGRVIRMIVIVDGRNRKRSLCLRERFLCAKIACAICTPEEAAHFKGAPVTVCFAVSETMLSLVSVRTAGTALIAVNVSGKHVYNPDAVIWDEKLHGDLADFVIALARERTGINPRELTAGDVLVKPDGVYFHMNYLALTDTEHLILFHLAAGADRFHSEEEIRKYACRKSDLRRKSSSVSVHICNINKKAIRAFSKRAIVCRRGSGYAVLTTVSTENKRARRSTFTPPFV